MPRPIRASSPSDTWASAPWRIFAYELLQQKAGIELNGVPYKGGAPMVTDLLGGHLPLCSDLLSNFVQLAKEKKVRLLAVTTARRMATCPTCRPCRN